MAKRPSIIDLLTGFVFVAATSSLSHAFHPSKILPVGRGCVEIRTTPGDATRQGGREQGVRSSASLFAEPIHQQPLETTPFEQHEYGSSTQISYYIPTTEVAEFTAEIKQGLQDSADRMSTYSEIVKGGVGERMGELQSNIGKTAQNLMIHPEDMLRAKQNLFGFVSDQLSYKGLIRSIKSLDDFWNLYVSSLDNKYELSGLLESLSSGRSLDEAASAITATTQDFVQALDLQQNAGFTLLVASFFWGSDQRRVGLERGRKIGDEQIQRLENELRLSKAVAQERNRIGPSEVEDLRQKMEDLQSEVEALTAITQEIGQELERTRAATSGVKSKSPEASPSLKASLHATSEASGTVVEPVGINAGNHNELDTERAAPKKDTPAKLTKKASVEAVNGAKKVKGDESPKKDSRTIKRVAPSDWGRLSASTLKRKTVKELVGYLAEKGVECTDASGKTLRKDSLVGLVLAE